MQLQKVDAPLDIGIFKKVAFSRKKGFSILSQNSRILGAFCRGGRPCKNIWDKTPVSLPNLSFNNLRWGGPPCPAEGGQGRPPHRESAASCGQESSKFAM
jgi:hypothetical protein